MSKLVVLTVDRCVSCPYSGDDINVTRITCKKMNNRMIVWAGEEEDHAPIPDWCPLPDAPRG